MNSAARTRLLMVVSLLTITVANCAGQPRESAATDAGPPTSTFSTVPSPTANVALDFLVVLPIEDDRVVWAAREKLVSECMADKGVAYIPEPYPTGGGFDPSIAPYPPPDALRQNGYNWMASSIGSVPAPVNDSSQYSIEQIGPCYENAVILLKQNGFAEAQDTYYSAASDIRVEVLSSPAYVLVLEEWAACMSRNGYPFESPTEAQTSVSPDYSTPMAISVAVADFSCQEEVQLEETRRALRSAATLDWLESNPGAVEALVIARMDYVEAAKTVLSG